MKIDNPSEHSELEVAAALKFWTDLEPTQNRLGTDILPSIDQLFYDIKLPKKRGRPIIDYPAKVYPSVHEIVFAAGFYEGEGYIGLDVVKQVLVTIGQNDREILDRLNLQFGGIVHGPYKNTKGNDCHSLALVRTRAIGFVLTIYKFLSKSRKEQIKAVLSGNPVSREYKKYEKKDKALDKYFGEIIKIKDTWMD